MSSSNILVIRHLDDIQDFSTSDRDNDILSAELIKIEGVVQSLKKSIDKYSPSAVRIISSPRKRCKGTTCELVKGIAPLLTKIPISVHEDPRIRGLVHGRYKIPPGYKPGDDLYSVEHAREAYVEQSFKLMDLSYRHGDPLIADQIAKYPELINQFSHYGESQFEFSHRFYSFLIDFYKEVVANRDILYVLVTHSAIILRLFELEVLFNKTPKQLAQVIPPGELAIFERRCMDDVLSGANGHELINAGKVSSCDISYVGDNQSLLKRELDFLHKNYGE